MNSIVMNVLKEMYSCSSVLLIGIINYKDLIGYVGFPVLQYRHIILKMLEGVKELCNIPDHLLRDYVIHVCRSIASITDVHVNKTALYEFVKLANFLGGYIVSLNVRDRLEPLSLFILNTRLRYKLLVTSYMGTEAPEYSLEDAIILGYILQTGDFMLAKKIDGILEYGNEYIVAPVYQGLLVVYKNDVPEDIFKKYGVETIIPIIPDNNPLRHVITLK